MTANAMMGVHFIGDDREVQTMLTNLENKLNSAGVASFLKTVVEPYVKSRAKSRFQSEGDDVVGMWAPLKPATEMFRSQHGFGAAHPINVRTGRLENYITGSPGDVHPHPMGATLVHPGSPPAGELKKKMETAQMGRSEPNTVPRPVIGLNERDLAFVMGSLATYIGTGLRP